MILRECRVCGVTAKSESELSLFVKSPDNKYGRRLMCKKCRQSIRTDKSNPEYSKRYYKNNKDRMNKESRKNYHANKDRYSRQAKSRYYTNRDERLRLVRAYAKDNQDKIVAYRKRYNQEHKAEKRENSRRYKLSKIQRTPLWLTDDDKEMMQIAYETAQERTKEFGFAWHVDHVIPLKGKRVCGLHVPSNLRVIPWRENLSKSNKYVNP